MNGSYKKIVALGKPGSHESPYRLVEFVTIETEKMVKCSATLLYSEHSQEDPGYLCSWSLEESFRETLSVPGGTIISIRSSGIGTYLRNRVIERAKKRFPGYSVNPATLSIQDGGKENFKRRHRFYASAGFKTDYVENTGAGKTYAENVDDLLVTRKEKDYVQISLAKLLKDLYRDKRDLKRKSDNFDEYFRRSQERLDQLSAKLTKFKIVASASLLLSVFIAVYNYV